MQCHYGVVITPRERLRMDKPLDTSVRGQINHAHALLGKLIDRDDEAREVVRLEALADPVPKIEYLQKLNRRSNRPWNRLRRAMTSNSVQRG